MSSILSYLTGGTAASTGCAESEAQKTTAIGFFAASIQQMEFIILQTQRIRDIAKANNNKLVLVCLGTGNDGATAAVAALRPRLKDVDEVIVLEAESPRQEMALDDEPTLLRFEATPSDARIESIESKLTAMHLNDSDENAVVITVAAEHATSRLERGIRWAQLRSGDLYPSIQSTRVVLSKQTVAWAVASTCASVAHAASAPVYTIARQVSLSDLQYDVNITVASLVTGVADFGIDTMRGRLGGCVVAGRHGDEVMRLVEWTDREPKNKVVMLLPEAYVRLCLTDYSAAHATVDSRVTVFESLGLPHSAAVPLRLPGVASGDEAVDSLDEHMGMRLWKLGGSSAEDDVWDALASKRAGGADAETSSPMAFQTQQEALKTHETTSQKGRAHITATVTLLDTIMDEFDPFAGLAVRWNLVDSGRQRLPILDIVQ